MPLVHLTVGTKNPRTITEAKLKFRDDRMKVADFGDNKEIIVGTHPFLPVFLNTVKCYTVTTTVFKLRLKKVYS
jgi:hypothetical protein